MTADVAVILSKKYDYDAFQHSILFNTLCFALFSLVSHEIFKLLLCTPQSKCICYAQMDDLFKVVRWSNNHTNDNITLKRVHVRLHLNRASALIIEKEMEI